MLLDTFPAAHFLSLLGLHSGNLPGKCAAKAVCLSGRDFRQETVSNRKQTVAGSQAWTRARVYIPDASEASGLAFQSLSRTYQEARTIPGDKPISQAPATANAPVL